MEPFRCVPLNESNDMLSLHKEDWRNIALHNGMVPLANKANMVTIVPISHGLRSQYDAHVQVSSDCTQWCFPSGIDKYFHLMFYNAILSKLQLKNKGEVVSIHSFSTHEENDYAWKLPPMLHNGG